MTTLQGKTVLITGAAGGFGQSMVTHFLSAGARLVLADLDQQALSDRTKLTLKAARLEHLADRILGYLAADLTNAHAPRAVHEASLALAPQIDLLINNAGIAMSGWFLDVPPERWEALMQVNLLAAMRLSALVAPAMVQRGAGHIVNMSSVAGFIGVPGLAAYSTAKFGLRGFTEALAGELKPHGVRVTGVYPFFAKTPILDSPHYGSMPRQSLPDRMLYDPDRIIAAMLRGIERNTTHVYPGATPKVLLLLTRLAPWLVRQRAGA